MIVVDIETTSLDREHTQIIDIGAVHHETGKELYIECRPDFTMPMSCNRFSSVVNGVEFEDWLNRSEEKYASQKDGAVEFVNWCLEHDGEKPVLGGNNIAAFDCMILCRMYDGNFDLNWPLGHRFVDIHSMFYGKFKKSLGSDDIAKYLDVEPEVKPHTGIAGARHESLIFKKLEV